MSKIKVMQVGLGPLGQKIAQFIEERNGIETVGAVDKNPELIGKNLGEHCGLKQSNVIIKESVKEALEGTETDVVVLTTVSDMVRITPQVEEIVALGLPIVSTCEELSYPWLTSKELSEKIDGAAKNNNVAVLGTGINPGYLMDLLPTALTAVCQHVETVKVERYQDATFRRIPFQKKIGAGMTLEEFEQRKKEGVLRHVGLTESVQMIADRMGWPLDKTEDVISPVIAEKEITTEAMTVKAGDAAGVHQVGKGFVNGVEKIVLDFKASIGETNPHDSVEIDGTPKIKSVIDGGVNGDIGTCAITINAIKQVLSANSGLRTMTDLAPVSFFME